jgi:hypothetical protein
MHTHLHLELLYLPGLKLKQLQLAAKCLAGAVYVRVKFPRFVH